METFAILAIVGLGLLAELHALRSLHHARRVRAAIRPHAKRLLLRKRRLAQADGDRADQAAWEVERRGLYGLFVPRRLRALVGPSTFAALLDAEFACVTNQEIERWTRIDRASTDWSSFEFEVATDLETWGWRIVRVGASHYWGADLYAYRDGTIAAVQCRFTDALVGVRPVHEASLVRERLSAHVVCVVSNNEYTPTAHRMADQTGVLLLHSSELGVVGAYAEPVGLVFHAGQAQAWDNRSGAPVRSDPTTKPLLLAA